MIQYCDVVLFIVGNNDCSEVRKRHQHNNNQKAHDPEFDPTPTTGYATWRTSMNRGSSMQGSSMRNELTDPVTLTFDLWTPKQYRV